MISAYSTNRLQLESLLGLRPHRKKWAAVFFSTAFVGLMIYTAAVIVFVGNLLAAEFITSALAFAVAAAAAAVMWWVASKTYTRF